MTSRPSLARYLDRIGYAGPLGANLETLKTIHRAHLRTIPYENLDIHLGRTLSLGLEFRLAESGGRWALHNHPFGAAAEFDFTLEPRTMGDFAGKCHELQTSPESNFVKATCVSGMRVTISCRSGGAVLRTVTEAGLHEHDVTSMAEYQGVLERRFGIHLPGSSRGPFVNVLRSSPTNRTSADRLGSSS